ncbi:MAG: sugar phosphate nucleotidyltransferase, partial [Bacteroidota bacterium]|nr:sugar phosphate nucleotidyltransferase [Bacteroidota bacterium]
ITGSGKTLLQATYDRFHHFIPADHIYIITHEYYRDQTMEAIPGFNEENIICEPSRNNTAASVALASFKLNKLDPDAVCIVSPADHIILKEDVFQQAIIDAVNHSYSFNSIITLGITPTRPDTGYGYIEFDKENNEAIRKVKSFREKPDLNSARQYLKEGNFAWNSGLFIWRLDNILNSFQAYSPQIYSVLAGGIDVYNTEQEQAFLRNEYPLTEKTSVDYAILEKAENVYTIPCDIGWSDLGTWSSLYDLSAKDENQNVALTHPVHFEDTKNTMLISSNEKLVVVRGLEDFIIVDTKDCLLIYPKSEEQNIKSLKESLNKAGLDNYL